MTDINEILKKQPILLIDGDCILCNNSVNYLLAREKEGGPKLSFVPLKSETGKVILDYFEIPNVSDTMILVKNYSVHIKSCAALRLTLYMKGLWPLLVAFVIIPPPLRNLVYDFIAKRRYKKFGKTTNCAMIDPKFRSRFLEI
jgi:predicted DCC family thiol-disulfide oxidoreductase YuxK